VAHWITSQMRWGFSRQALNSCMKQSAVKAGRTGEAPHFRVIPKVGNWVNLNGVKNFYLISSCPFC